MIKLQDILEFLLPVSFWGDNSIEINSILQLSNANQDEHALMWCSPKNSEKLELIEFGTIICSQLPSIHDRSMCNYIVVENPRQAFQKVVNRFFNIESSHLGGISSTAIIHSNVAIGYPLYVGEFVVIEEDCIIGSNVFIDHHTVIKRNTRIGDNVRIGSSNVIGGVGFGYEKNESGDYEVILHIGNVVIEDDVEIGNCTCIDRAVLGSTLIRRNVKIDNLVHIAHGVEIGANSLVIANAMIAGSVKVGMNVWIAPSSSILNKKCISNNAVIGMGAVVIKDVEENQIVIGNPAKPLQK